MGLAWGLLRPRSMLVSPIVGFGGEVFAQSTPGFVVRFSHTFIGLKELLAWLWVEVAS
jgi:hypothetical protein